jgi:tetratricopeptide (TPR) repeat protein
MAYPRQTLILLATALGAGCTTLEGAPNDGQRVAVDSYYVLAQVARADNRPEDATRHMLEAALLSDDAAYAERATRSALDLGLTELGLRAAERWEQLAPDDDRIVWFQANLRFRAGDLDLAIQHFAEMLDNLTTGNAGTGLALVVDTLDAESDSAGATRVVAALVDRYPDYAEGHFGLARLAMNASEFGLALEHAETAARLAPEWSDAQLLYARALLIAGRPEESLELAESLVGESSPVEIRLQYAELLLSDGRSGEAEVILNELLEDNPGLPAATRALAFLALANDRFDDAERYFSEMRSVPQFRDEAFYYLGRIAETQGDALQATRSYSRVIEGNHAVEAQIRTAAILLEEMSDPEGALRHLEEFGAANEHLAVEMLIARGQILLQLDQPDEALELVETALAENPDEESLQDAHVQLYLYLAQDAIDRDELALAESTLDEALDIYPDNSSLRYSQALLYEDQGRIRHAARVLEDLVEEEPDNPALLNALGYLLTDQFDRHDEAHAYIQRALEMQPDNAAIIDSMGWVLFKLGELDSALEYLERAYALVTDPEMAAHLVEVHWMLGNRQRALELLESNLDQFPNSRHLIDVNRRLRE